MFIRFPTSKKKVLTPGLKGIGILPLTIVTPVNFTWEALSASQAAFFENLRAQLLTLKNEGPRTTLSIKNEKVETFRSRFISEVYDDLNTPEGIGRRLGNARKSNIPSVTNTTWLFILMKFWV